MILKATIKTYNKSKYLFKKKLMKANNVKYKKKEVAIQEKL